MESLTKGILPGPLFKTDKMPLAIHYVLSILCSLFLGFLGMYLYWTKHEVYDDDTFRILPMLNGMTIALSVLNVIQSGFTFAKIYKEGEPSYDKDSPGREGFMFLKFREVCSSIILVCVTIVYAYADVAGNAVCPIMHDEAQVSKYDNLGWVKNADGCPESCTEDCDPDKTHAKLIVLVLWGFIIAIVHRLVTMGISVKEVLLENCPEDDLGKLRSFAGSERGYTVRKFSILVLLLCSMGANVATIGDKDNSNLDIAQVSNNIPNDDFKDSHHMIFVFVIVLNVIHTFLALMGVILTGTKRSGGDDTARNTCLQILSCNRCFKMCGTVDDGQECEEGYEKFYVYNQIPIIRFLVINSSIVLLSFMIGQSAIFNLDIQYPALSLVFVLLADAVANHDF